MIRGMRNYAGGCAVQQRTRWGSVGFWPVCGRKICACAPPSVCSLSVHGGRLMRTCLILVAPALVASAAMAQVDMRKDNSGYAARAATGSRQAARHRVSGTLDFAGWTALGPYGGDVKVV